MSSVHIKTQYSLLWWVSEKQYPVYTVIIQLQKKNKAAQLRRREMDVEAEINNELPWEKPAMGLRAYYAGSWRTPWIRHWDYITWVGKYMLMLPLEILPLALHFHDIVDWSLNLFQTKLEMIVASQWLHRGSVLYAAELLVIPLEMKQTILMLVCWQAREHSCQNKWNWKGSWMIWGKKDQSLLETKKWLKPNASPQKREVCVEYCRTMMDNSMTVIMCCCWENSGAI